MFESREELTDDSTVVNDIEGNAIHLIDAVVSVECVLESS